MINGVISGEFTPVDGRPDDSRDRIVRERTSARRGSAASSPLLTVRVRSPLRLPSDWDAFAEHCQGSYLALAGCIATTVVTSVGMATARSYEVFVRRGAEEKKLAQATVMRRDGEYWFLHPLAIDPALEELWPVAMKAILERAGAGAYVYNGFLFGVASYENSRADEIRAIKGVTIDSVRAFVEQSVFFRNWKSWDDYYRSVSTNSKRNYKRAQKEIEGLNILTKRGLAALTEVPFLAKCKQNTLVRKGYSFSGLIYVIRFAIRAALTGQRQFVTVVRSGERRLSAIGGIEFGDTLWYVDGGRSDDRNGAQWFLMLEAMKSFYDRCPGGVFDLGYFDETIHDEAVGGGLVRFRRACQASDRPSSVVRFHYEPS